MKTSELTGAALDWAVAKCENKAFAEPGEVFKLGYSPSINWAQGGPIIERNHIELHNATDGSKEWVAHTNFQVYAFGPTPLIAAMRCHVASKMGDNVDIPAEFM